MSEIPGPAHIHLQLAHTPSPDDPKGAPDFYQALGTFVMAWGRLEAHVLACIIDIMQAPDTFALVTKIPALMSEYIALWKDAFRESPKLKPYEAEAFELINRVAQLNNKRNQVIHGHWEPFNLTLITSADVVWIKRATGTKMGIVYHRFTVSSDLLREYTYEASNMNIELLRFSNILAAERGPPPLDAYKL